MYEGDGYQNKYFSLLGDSLSTLLGYSEPSHAVFYDAPRGREAGVLTPRDTWWGQVIEALGGRLLVNDSFSGSTVSRHPRCEIPSYACSDERTARLHRDGARPHVIMVLMGMNDWGMGVPLVPESAAKAEDPAVFSVAYGLMLKKLRKSYPEAEIWCLTLPVSVCGEGEEFPYRRGGRHIEAYSAVIREEAERQGCRIVELYRPDMPYDTVDGFHPSAAGMRTLADAVLASIK